MQRAFAVEHAPWKLRRPKWVRCLTSMIESAFPWFERGEWVGAHETDGLCDVRMTCPRTLNPLEPAFPARRRLSRNRFFSVLD